MGVDHQPGGGGGEEAGQGGGVNAFHRIPTDPLQPGTLIAPSNVSGAVCGGCGGVVCGVDMLCWGVTRVWLLFYRSIILSCIVFINIIIITFKLPLLFKTTPCLPSLHHFVFVHR